MSTPFRPTINFFQHVIIYIAKIMGLLHANRAQRKARYFTYYSHRDIELDGKSDIDVLRVFLKILVNSSRLLGFEFFLMFSISFVFKERTVNCALYHDVMTQKFKLIHLYPVGYISTILQSGGVVLKRRWNAHISGNPLLRSVRQNLC